MDPLTLFFLISGIVGFIATVIQLYKWFLKKEDHISNNSSMNIHKVPVSNERLIIPGYSLGSVNAEVYLGLLGGGTEIFTRQTLTFQYDHEWVPLPDIINEQRDILIADQVKDAQLKGHELFNGPAIRLHSFNLGIYQDKNGEEKKCPQLFLRPTCWYDYSISNKIIDKKFLISGKGESTIRNEYADATRLLRTHSIDWIQLSNILTITVVLITKDSWTLLGRRTRHVDNASQLLSASSAENIHRWKDEPSDPANPWSRPKRFTEIGKEIGWDYKPLACPNPFFTAIRAIEEEVSEELSKVISYDDVTFLSLAWDQLGFNPHLYASIRIDITMHELQHVLDGSRGRDSWESTLIPVKFEPTGMLKEFLLNEDWAQISKGAILRTLVQEYSYAEVNKNLNK